MLRLPELPDLPVRPALPRIVEALAGGGAAVLVAPPGSGKTTLVPLALASRLAGRIVVAEPRRVATRAAASRMASLLGERVGGTVGYTVRGERRVTETTRIEVVTTGVLVRRLQRDPELPGVDAVVLDECHERHLDSDLGLAFSADVRAALRPDLALLATSATAASESLAAALSGAPVLAVDGSPHPIRTVWCPPPAPVTPPHGSRVDPRLLDQVAAVVRRAVAETPGDVLVFLPGWYEIDAVSRRLSGLDVDLAPLHGRLPAREQDAVLRPAQRRRRIVLATAVAESSLTVPGVRAVVDAGLARVPRLDQARGLGALVTVPVSRATATQRAGRAGREAPGTVYRCWSDHDHQRLPAWPEAEIAAADLTAFALDLACWGAPTGAGLALPDQPPPAALEIAQTTLRALGATGTDGRVTPHGRSLATLGVHPRLANALLDGAATVGVARAVEIVAVLADDALGGGRGDLAAVWRGLRAGADEGASRRWRAESRRLRSETQTLIPDAPPAAERWPDDLAAGLLVGLAYPERLAKARHPGGSSYLMAGGTEAQLPAGSPLAGANWLAVAVADRAPGQAAARIRLAAAIDEATAVEAGKAALASTDEVGWVDGEVMARRRETLGAITLAERPLRQPDRQAVRDAVLEGLRREGIGLLRWSADARTLRSRLGFCAAVLGPPWPPMDDAALLDRAPDWLGPELASARRRADLARIDAGAALRRALPWPEAGRLDELAPERLTVPSGSRIRVDYTDPAAPVLAVKVQEAFGWEQAPTVGGGRVPVRLHLLSPAGRPVACTSDLASFWRNGYPQVRAELRGRYPRHPWPDDPA